ncbi:hypothetical protein [Microbacterium sp. No. 7]|uniref:hypothetical protein n=1 Tax=Microbacterium sp. No. 7 TaxID=1714373 RepID=UPI0006D0DD55|nr:hypothetical protein [Microbacterium sp. No. 7]ALJ22514.1 hypothetical protein AOA12_23375 [Microbacterium sp. No. 7]
MAERDEDREVARFYTRSRRFPKFIGRLHDGTKIPGGPYTLTQGIVLALVLIGALLTQRMWGTGSPLVDFPLAIAFSWAAAWGAGRIPATRRNMLNVLAGGLSAMTKPATGKYRGTTMKIRPPHYAGGKTTIADTIVDALPRPEVAIPTPTPEAPAAVQPAMQQRSAPLATRTPAHAVSGVERLLQQARGGN